MSIDFEWEGVEYRLPTVMEVCPTCHGRGRHVNRAIDGNGITRDEMDDLGPEFLDDYLGGIYDVTCEQCDGANVIEVADHERMTEQQALAWLEWREAEWEADAADRVERAYFSAWER